MPVGKTAGVPCIHLSTDLQCSIYKSPDRPKICGAFRADPEICGNSRAEAFSIMAGLEDLSMNKSGIDAFLTSQSVYRERLQVYGSSRGTLILQSYQYRRKRLKVKPVVLPENDP